MIRWIDLSTPDVERAGAFHTGLLGWTADGRRFGESAVARLDGQDVAGMTAAGVPAASVTDPGPLRPAAPARRAA